MVVGVLIGVVLFFMSFRNLIKLLEEKEEFRVPQKIADLTFKLNYKLIIISTLEVALGKKMVPIDANDGVMTDLTRQYNIYYLCQFGVNSLLGLMLVNMPAITILAAIGIICSIVVGVFLKYNLYMFIRNRVLEA